MQLRQSYWLQCIHDMMYLWFTFTSGNSLFRSSYGIVGLLTDSLFIFLLRSPVSLPAFVSLAMNTIYCGRHDVLDLQLSYQVNGECTMHVVFEVSTFRTTPTSKHKQKIQTQSGVTPSALAISNNSWTSMWHVISKHYVTCHVHNLCHMSYDGRRTVQKLGMTQSETYFS